jgi:hypothetical protein
VSLRVKQFPDESVFAALARVETDFGRELITEPLNGIVDRTADQREPKAVTFIGIDTTDLEADRISFAPDNRGVFGNIKNRPPVDLVATAGLRLSSRSKNY